MPPGKRRILALAVIAAAFAVARLPLHLATWGLPVSNDDAIPLLMAGRLLKGELSTILWNQPYNGTLDTYLLAPLVAVASPHAAFRVYEIVCGLLLVAVVGLLAGRSASDDLAGWAAALLAAVGAPYMALMAATGPTPNFLVPLLVAAVTLFGCRRVDGPSPAPAALAAGCGLVSGLAVWNSMVALPALLGAGAGLAAAGLRPRVRSAMFFVAGALAGLAPLAIARAAGSSAASTVTALRPQWLWTAGLRDLARAAAGLFGLQVPLVVDGPERAALPLGLAIGLGLALIGLALAGATQRRTWPLVGWLVAAAAAFAASRRTGGDEIRYLFGASVPALALSGVGLSRLMAARARAWRAAGVAATALVLAGWAVGHLALLHAWRDPAHATRVWQVPPLGPALGSLQRADVRSAYASLQFAGRLMLESDGRVIASQAWNERIPGDPLRFRDEVDLDPRAGWVLSPHLSRGMPRASGFRALLQGLGGRWHEDVAGDLQVFRAFRPPFDESRPVPAGEMAARSAEGAILPATVLDRDAATAWASPAGLARGAGLAITLTHPRRLSALVLVLPAESDAAAVSWVCEVDGLVVAMGPARDGLQWVAGVPRAGRQGQITVPLGDRPAQEIRLIFQASGPLLEVAEAILYGPDEEPQPAAGAVAAEAALLAAREGDWDAAVRGYAQAARLEPGRASHHRAEIRSRWRAARRQRLDVESLGDGGPVYFER